MMWMPKGQYDRSASRWEPRFREYPPELVARVRELYESGMTIREVQAAIGAGVKVQRLMQNCGIRRRPAAKRDQAGENNHMWKGSEAKYHALHLRVSAERGRPMRCERCGTEDVTARYEWANLTSNYEDVNDYQRMCVPCHRVFDAERRTQESEPLIPEHLRRSRA